MKTIKTSGASWQEWKDGFKCGKCNTLSEVTHRNLFGIRLQQYEGDYKWHVAYQCPKCSTINKVSYPQVPHAVKVRMSTYNVWKENDPLNLPKIHEQQEKEN